MMLELGNYPYERGPTWRGAWGRPDIVGVSM